MVVECDRPMTRRGLPKFSAGERVMRDDDGIRSPLSRPVVYASLAGWLRSSDGQKRRGRGLAKVRRNRIPFGVEDLMLIMDEVATLRFGRRVDLVGSIGIDEAAVLVQVYGSNVQRLVKVAQEMGEHKESLLLVGDRIWPRREYAL